MEEEIEQDKRQPQSAVHTTLPPPPPPPPTTTTTTTTTSAIGKPAKDTLDEKTALEESGVVVVVGSSVEDFKGDSSPATTMGIHRSGLTGGGGLKSGEGVGGVSHLVQSPTTPRQPSKRDSGYHTDYSPATFTPTPTPNPAPIHFTFDSSPESPIASSPPLLQQSSQVLELPSPILEQGGEGSGEPFFSSSSPSSSSYCCPREEDLTGTSIDAESSSVVASWNVEYGAEAATSSSPEKQRGSRGPQQGSSSSSSGGSSNLGGIITTSTPLSRRHGTAQQHAQSVWQDVEKEEDKVRNDDNDDDDGDAFVSDDVSAVMTSRLSGVSSVTTMTFSGSELGALNLTPSAVLTLGGQETEEAEEGRVLETCSQRLGGPVGSNQKEEGEEEDRSGTSSRDLGGAKEESSEEEEEEEEEDECEEEGMRRGQGVVASTAFHHGPLLSVVRLPGGGRMRPLQARTTATQTPHLLCQLIRQVLASPGPVPHTARGNVFRRLRSYSEGEEETMAIVQGPLPDLVPVAPQTFHRERAYSSPDVEALHRQRETARAVGRELRRISDEFVRNHEARRGQPHWALAVLHAELNEVVVFVVRGIRRLLHIDPGAYLRHHALRWTARQPPARPFPPDSPVDGER